MGIVKDRSDLPPGDMRDGIPPERASHVVDAVVTSIRAHIDAERAEAYGTEDGYRPMSREGAVFRHSDASGCARALGYKMLGVPFTEPPTDTDVLNMHIGTMIHDAIDKALTKHGDGWRCEVPCGFDEPVRTAGTADAVGDHDAHRTVVETKSTGGYPYKLAIGERGQADGPKWGHIVQGALNASALDADEMVILYVAKELVSKGIAEKKGIPEIQRGIAAWHYTPDQFRPIAEGELRRVKRVHELVVKGEPVPAAVDDPEIPRGARIVDPSTGRWQVTAVDGQVIESGTYWGCGYCWHRSHCAAAMAAEKRASAAA